MTVNDRSHPTPGFSSGVSNAVVHAANTAVITGIQRTLFTFIVPVVLLRDVKIDRAPGAQLLRHVALNLTTFVVLAIRAVRIAAHIRRFTEGVIAAGRILVTQQTEICTAVKALGVEETIRLTFRILLICQLAFCPGYIDGDRADITEVLPNPPASE